MFCIYISNIICYSDICSHNLNINSYTPGSSVVWWRDGGKNTYKTMKEKKLKQQAEARAEKERWDEDDKQMWFGYYGNIASSKLKQ